MKGQSPSVLKMFFMIPKENFVIMAGPTCNELTVNKP